MALVNLMSGFAAIANNVLSLGTPDYNSTSYPLPKTEEGRLKIDPDNEGSEQSNIFGRFYVVQDKTYG